MESYYYRVDIFCTTFGKDAAKTKPFTYSEVFKGDDLLECRNRAIEFYREKMRGVGEASFVFPFKSAQKFEFGKNSAISIELLLVEIDGGEEFLYSLSEPEDREETAELEKNIFGELGCLNF